MVEMKSVKFKPEFAGKLNFYVSAVDDILKAEQDNPTVGILICLILKTCYMRAIFIRLDRTQPNPLFSIQLHTRYVQAE